MVDPRQEALDLTGRVHRGDQEAQRAFVLRLIQGVRRTVGSILRGDSEADDVMQVAMIEILRSAPSYRGDASLERWAHRIAARTAIRHLRARRARTQAVDAEVEPAELAAAPGAEEAPLRAEGVGAYLDQLSEARRVCVVLRHVHGYTVDEIAELTETSPNTVKDQLLQGRAQLRRLVRREEAAGAGVGTAAARATGAETGAGMRRGR